MKKFNAQIKSISFYTETRWNNFQNDQKLNKNLQDQLLNTCYVLSLENGIFSLDVTDQCFYPNFLESETGCIPKNVVVEVDGLEEEIVLTEDWKPKRFTEEEIESFEIETGKIHPPNYPENFRFISKCIFQPKMTNQPKWQRRIQQRDQQMIEMSEHYSFAEISRRLGVSRELVRQRLKPYGIKGRKICRRLSKEEEKELKVQNKLTTKQIAELIGFEGGNSIMQMVYQGRFPRPTDHRYVHRAKINLWDEEVVMQWCELRLYSIKESIANTLETTRYKKTHPRIIKSKEHLDFLNSQPFSSNFWVGKLRYVW